MKWIGEEDGCPLVLCVFHNITDLKEAQLEKEHLINSIPGGIASYRVEGERFIPEFYSDGVMMISGHTRMEFEAMVRRNAFDVIYEIFLWKKRNVPVKNVLKSSTVKTVLVNTATLYNMNPEAKNMR